MNKDKHTKVTSLFFISIPEDLPVWLGVSDSDVEGVWRCIGTGHVVANKNDSGYPGPMFHTSEPNGGVRDNCVVMISSLNYLLGDVPCLFPFAYMCEKDQP